MIVVVFNKPDFEYDVHSLLKEFFPQEDVQMYYSCSPDEVEGKNLACTHHEMTDDGVKEFADASQVFKIDYVGDEIAVEWTVNRTGGNNSMNSRKKYMHKNICDRRRPQGDQKPPQARPVFHDRKGYRKEPSVGHTLRYQTDQNSHEMYRGRHER